jgi:choice-of-anchor C domain-containing protein
MRVVICPIALLLAISFPQRARADSILINGSFELGPPPFSNQDIDIPSASTAITGWLVTGNGIDLLGYPWDVSDGIRAIDLDGRSPGGIEQTFATDVGQTYVVSFDLSGNPGNGQPGTGLPIIKQLLVSVDDFAQQYAFDSSGLTIEALTWQTIMFSFIASDTTATLSFTASRRPATRTARSSTT